MSGAEGERFSGLLSLDKPAGMTSHDVVLEVRKRLGSPGAGHLGTLDPPASGLLLLALGAATRAIPLWSKESKVYEGRARFGVTTSTQDLAGEIESRADASGLSDAQVREASTRFVGEVQQVPPMVSAVKVGGERLHRMARRGLVIERAARPVHVAEWEWLSFALPEAEFRIRCSAGTYVRTLVHDLGAVLGCGAALATLRRTRIGRFGLEDAASWAELTSEPADRVLARAGTPLDRALEALPGITLDAQAAAQIGTGGRPVVARGAAPLLAGPRSLVLRSPEGRPLALGELQPHTDDRLAIVCPRVVFPWAVRQGAGSARPAPDPVGASGVE